MGSTNFENGISQNSLAQIKNSLLYDPLYAQPMPATMVSYPQPPSLSAVIFDWCGVWRICESSLLLSVYCNLFQLWTIVTVKYFVWLAPKKRGCCDGIFILIDAIATVLLLPHIFGYYVCFIMFSAYKKMKEENQTNYQSSCDIEMIVDPTSSQCGACGSNLST